jgi:putative nucleotidyltransferase with HDIG domain
MQEHRDQERERCSATPRLDAIPPGKDAPAFGEGPPPARQTAHGAQTSPGEAAHAPYHIFGLDRRVLVVDDSPSLLLFVKQGLEKAGFTVDVADNGRAALELIRAHPFDVILCDVNMPVMDGFELRRKLLGKQKYARIPFIVISVSDRESDIERMRSMGIAGYVTKPFKVEQLVVLLERLFNDQAMILRRENELLESEKKMMLASILSLAEALDARDVYTHAHSQHVSIVSVKIACAMGLGLDEIEIIEMAGKLHDIGKIGVADAILQKPSSLTDEEFAIIRKHPETGARILAPIQSLTQVADIIRMHHERHDGRGYPDGVIGGEIVLPARIISIADTFDAISTDRPYRKGRSRAEAAHIIGEERGRQFCPDCVDAFLSLDWR